MQGMRTPRVPPPGKGASYGCCQHCKHQELMRHPTPCPHGCNGVRNDR